MTPAQASTDLLRHVACYIVTTKSLRDGLVGTFITRAASSPLSAVRRLCAGCIIGAPDRKLTTSPLFPEKQYFRTVHV